MRLVVTGPALAVPPAPSVADEEAPPPQEEQESETESEASDLESGGDTLPGFARVGVARRIAS